MNLLKQDFKAQSGDVDAVVFHVSQRDDRLAGGARGDHAAAGAGERRSRMSRGSSVPTARRGAVQVSPNRMTAFATVNYDQPANVLANATGKPLLAQVNAVHVPGLQVAAGGQVVENAEGFSVGPATEVGVIAALIILLLTFGSLAAAGMPLITAGLGLITGVALIGLATHVTNLSNISPELALMIGLGVGIDYSLFIVTRFRENYVEFGDVERSVVEAMDTSGRAILLAGATVVIALLGMFATGVAFMYGLAIAAVLAVLLTLVASLTLLPALLSRFGPRLVRPRGARNGRSVAVGRRRPRPTAGPAVVNGANGAAVAAPPRSAWRRWSADRAGASMAAGDRVAGGDGRAAGAGVRDAAGLKRRRERPGQHQLAPCVRSSCAGVRGGVQRSAAAGRGAVNGRDQAAALAALRAAVERHA